MEAGAAVHEGQPQPGLGADDPELKGERAVEAYARDHEDLTPADERDALDFLLAPKPPRQYGVRVQYDTEAGLKPLTFVIRGMDGRKLDSIEQANVSEATGTLDRITADCQLVAEATLCLEDASGRKVELGSPEFLTIRRPKAVGAGDELAEGEERFDEHRLASPADALEARFKTQLGLLNGVAREIRRISGYDPERVGVARRRLVDAVGNS